MPVLHRASHWSLIAASPLLLSPAAGSARADETEAIEAAQIGAEITATPATVSAGAELSLEWQATDAETAFVSTLGIVEVQGAADIRPLASQTYTLVAESAAGVRTDSVEVEVTGAKSGGPLTDRSRFGHPIRGISQVDRLTRFLALLHDLLQEQMGFSVEELQLPGGPFLFVTDEVRRNGLADKSRRIKAHMLAYMIEVEMPDRTPAEVVYTIKTAMTYQKRIERTSRKETNAEIHKKEAQKLKEAIETSLRNNPP